MPKIHEETPSPLDLAPRERLLETVMRAAADPTVDPARLEKFLEIGRQLEQDRAKADYAQNFVALKKELPVINKNGVVLNKRGGVQFKYARYDDLHEAVTPLLDKYGFATSFDFEEPGEGRLTCILELEHIGPWGSWSKFYHWTLPSMGENQYVTNLQNAAAARSFAKRCVLIDALDIRTQDTDSGGAPVAAAQLISEAEARSIEDKLAACEERQKGVRARFEHWLKTEVQADQIRELFEGAQHERVMKKLKATMEKLGIL